MPSFRPDFSIASRMSARSFFSPGTRALKRGVQQRFGVVARHVQYSAHAPAPPFARRRAQRTRARITKSSAPPPSFSRIHAPSTPSACAA